MDLNTESSSSKNDLDYDEFELNFKPITSGLGFHHETKTSLKSTVSEKRSISPLAKREENVIDEVPHYKNGLSFFYDQANAKQSQTDSPNDKDKSRVIIARASKTQRFFAYVIDCIFLFSILCFVVITMAKIVQMEPLELLRMFPQEIIPLILSLFLGFYLIYFSLFEKMYQATLGKHLLGLRVVAADQGKLPLTTLLLRSSLSLLNFFSLGLFSYFDLVNKFTSSEVIKVH